MPWLLVQDGIIKNAIAISSEAAQTYTPPDGMELVYTDEWFNIGWEWDGTKPVEPLEENPPHNL